ncbi:hypothetical protein [Streptomyces sp. enrichment culture]|uniref:hypothetical protein n=1 Tax=Streptomyces sp. enrichment culture TaxID=1795815 RepID=UPI003F571A38
MYEDLLARRSSLLARCLGPDELPADLDFEHALRALVADAAQPAGEGVGDELRQRLTNVLAQRDGSATAQLVMTSQPSMVSADDQLDRVCRA